MPNSSKKPSSTISGKVAELPYDNPGEIVILWNPAPYLSRQKLKEAEENGTPIEHHRENTPWLLSVPTLNVTMTFHENNTPLTGYQNWKRLVRLADSIITQLRKLSPKELSEYQNGVPECENWPAETKIGGTYYAKTIPTGR